MGNRQKKHKKKYVPYSEEYRRSDGSYGGLLCRNSKGKWAATWNVVPENDSDSYCFDSKYEATLFLSSKDES
jgi:hypothetical protein